MKILSSIFLCLLPHFLAKRLEFRIYFPFSSSVNCQFRVSSFPHIVGKRDEKSKKKSGVDEKKNLLFKLFHDTKGSDESDGNYNELRVTRTFKVNKQISISSSAKQDRNLW